MSGSRFDKTRRRFFTTTAAVGAAGVSGAIAETGGGSTRDDYDVAIVGGGFAGATAARELGKAGYRVVLL